MSPDEIRQLFDYNAWANQRSLDAAAALTAEDFTKPLGSSFSSVRDTLAHIWGAEWLWLERFQGVSPASLPEVGQFNDVSLPAITLATRPAAPAQICNCASRRTTSTASMNTAPSVLAHTKIRSGNPCSTWSITAPIIAARLPPCSGN